MANYLSLIGGVFAAYGQEVESKAAERVAEYNRRVALENAEIARASAEHEALLAEREGTLAKQAAAVRAADIRRAGERVTATGRQQAAAMGLRPDEGSALLLQLQNAREAEIAALREEFSGSVAEMAFRDEAARIRYAGALQARGFRQEATLLKHSIKLEQRVRPIRGAATILGASYSPSAVSASGRGGTVNVSISGGSMWTRTNAGGMGPGGMGDTYYGASGGWYL